MFTRTFDRNNLNNTGLVFNLRNNKSVIVKKQLFVLNSTTSSIIATDIRLVSATKLHPLLTPSMMHREQTSTNSKHFKVMFTIVDKNLTETVSDV